MKKLIEEGETANLNLEKYSIHISSGLLKHFLRSLSEPIFPYEYYPVIIAVEKNSEKGKITLAQKLDEFQKIINSLPYINRLLLEKLFLFLRLVATYSSENKMTPSNLAVVFGPTLIRAKQETIETSLEIALVNASIQCLIENPEITFLSSH